MTVGELGEFGLIAAITERLRGGAQVIVGVGDDAAVVGVEGARVVATTDMLIEGRHFRREWSSATDIGAKVAARNLADVAAMGAVPVSLLVAFAGPGNLSVDWVLDLVDGIADECAVAGASVAGGDTSEAGTVMLAVTALGDLQGRAPVLRSGARPGDVVAVAGTLGSAAAGLALLSAGGAPAAGDLAAGGPHAGRGDRLGALIRAHQRPVPPYPAGPQAAELGATALIDISDGLLADLGHVAEASGVGIDLRSGLLLAEPVSRADLLRQAASVLGTGSWQEWVLAGGDDHALVATFSPDVALPGTWTVIGSVTSGNTVLVDGRPTGGQRGWEHFRPCNA